MSRSFGQDSMKTLASLTVAGKEYHYFSIKKAAELLGKNIHKLPFSLRVLLENLLRFEDGESVTKDDISAMLAWLDTRTSTKEIAYRPARVLMQDFTGVPAVVDLAAMRDAVKQLGGDVKKINPLAPVDLVIDHSVQVDKYASARAFKDNVTLEMNRNKERYEFLRWGQEAFDNFRVVPPGTGICHQVNLEYLASVVCTEKKAGKVFAFPDTVVGTDSHTTMINGLAVLGWGVGGIEAEAAMLGQPVSMLIPEVVGFKLTGKLKEGTTATDLVLTVTQMLREKGVVGKFVEFYGNGLEGLPLADRATIANMAPEYGATCGFFPIDEETLKYLRLSARDESQVTLVEAFAKAQGFWRDSSQEDPTFTSSLSLNLSDVQPSLAGPKRPQDRVLLMDMAKEFKKALPDFNAEKSKEIRKADVEGQDYTMADGHVAIAAITSCTNTSNPNVMIAAGLLAKNALAKGLQVKPWVKTSLAPGSQVVSEYLERAGLQTSLDELGFNLVGYGCTTCIGNSGPLKLEIEASISDSNLVVASVLSGNRNFEGRVHPLVRVNYLASPPLVVAYAIAGSITIDLLNEPLGISKDGKEVFLKDIWPSNHDIADTVAMAVTAEMFREKYANVFAGDKAWQSIDVKKSTTYGWSKKSTYIKHPPYFEGMGSKPSALEDFSNCHVLLMLGDSVTTDHISPAGNIAKSSPAAKYLSSHDVEEADYNSYGARRGNDDIMTRGTFANIRIRNEMVPDTEGGITKYTPTGEIITVYEAAMRYKKDDIQLVVIAGKEYGTGSSRDWAAKGTKLLGVKAVIAESFERIHRSNLIGMGVLPLLFKKGDTRKTLKLDGAETFSFSGVADLKPSGEITCVVTRKEGGVETIQLDVAIYTADEMGYYQHGGILHKVIRDLC